jgi:hypothetical protein
MRRATTNFKRFSSEADCRYSQRIPDAIVFSSFGVAFGIRGNDPVLYSRALEHIPPGSRLSSSLPTKIYTLRKRVQNGVAARRDAGHRTTPKRGSRIEYELLADDSQLLRTANLDRALQVFESDLQMHIAEMCPDKVFVHAGVVGWGGGAIVIPGASGAGKTTLVARLLELGATYYSDEYAAIDRLGRVHPYARPLRVKQCRTGVARQCEPEALGARRGAHPIPISLVLVTEYQQGANWEPRQLTPGHTVLALLSNTVSIRRQPQAAVPVLCRAMQGARALTSVRGDAETLARVITGLDFEYPGKLGRKAVASVKKKMLVSKEA